MTEGDSRHSHQLVGFAIAARVEKRDNMRGQIGQRGLPHHLGFAKHGDQLDLGLIANDHISGIRSEAVESRRRTGVTHFVKKRILTIRYLLANDPLRPAN